MAIAPDNADFTPSIGQYTPLKPFRFWCQMVLPAVYDDSLSYYELLSKVIDYLNKTMEDVETSIEDVSNLNTAYGELEDYVNETLDEYADAYNDFETRVTENNAQLMSAFETLSNFVNSYFENLDVQDEIDNKLDEMVLDGTLNDIVEPIVQANLLSSVPSAVENWLDNNVEPTMPLVDYTLSINEAASESSTVGEGFTADRDKMDIVTGLTGYGYSVQTLEADPESSSTQNKIGVHRNGSLFTLTGTSDSTYVTRVKFSGNIDRAASSAYVQTWNTGVPVVNGHSYRLTLLKSGGSVSNTGDQLPRLEVYEVESSTAIGELHISGDNQNVDFTAGSNAVNLCMYIYPNTTFTDYKFQLLLVDITEGVAPSVIKSDFDKFSSNVIEELNDVNDSIGEPPITEISQEYTFQSGKRSTSSTSVTTVAELIKDSDNGAWKVGATAVTPGDNLKITFYSYGSANADWITFADNNGNIVSFGYYGVGTNSLETKTVTVPEGATLVYVFTYSSDGTLPANLIIKKLVPLSVIEYIDIIKNDTEKIVSELYSEYRYPVYHSSELTQGAMNITTGGINTSNDTAVCTPMITIFSPALLTIPDGYMCSVNQYDNNTTASTARFIENKYVDTDGKIIISDETYPCFIKICFTNLVKSSLAPSDYTTIANYTLTSCNNPYLYASISMFTKFAITGCSWDAGSAYHTIDGHVTQSGIGWGENVARRNGLTLGNYAIGGQNIRSWFNYSAEDDMQIHSFKQLLTDDAYPLYVLIWGNSNDAGSGFVLNDSNYSYSNPSTTTYYIGSIQDISTRENYSSYPCTFYGYYGRVIEMIQAHAPGARIIISSPDTTTPTNEIRYALRTACEEIANYYSLPYMDIESDPYYPVYVNVLDNLHPTAVTYSGWSMAFERLFAKCVQDNASYFDLWSGIIPNTVSVQWEVVEL